VWSLIFLNHYLGWWRHPSSWWRHAYCKKTTFLLLLNFLLLLRCLLPFRSIVYVFMFKGYFIMQWCHVCLWRHTWIICHFLCPRNFKPTAALCFCIYCRDIITKKTRKWCKKAYFSKCNLISDVIMWFYSDISLLFSL